MTSEELLDANYITNAVILSLGSMKRYCYVQLSLIVTPQGEAAGYAGFLCPSLVFHLSLKQPHCAHVIYC